MLKMKHNKRQQKIVGIMAENIKNRMKSHVSGRLKAGISYKQVGENIIFMIPYYGEFVDKGRKPGGKMPPIESLQMWSKVTNVWGLAKHIQEDGIKPNPFLYEININRYFNKLNNAAFYDVMDDIGEEFKKIGKLKK